MANDFLLDCDQRQHIANNVKHVSSSNSNALYPSVLDKLPVELIQEITSALPLGSAALFSMCCRAIYQALGPQYLQKLGKSEAVGGQELLMFLRLLEDAMPDHIFCGLCRRLHHIRTAAEHTRAMKVVSRLPRRSCIIQDYVYAVYPNINTKFNSVVFAMAMKRYRQGRSYAEMLSLLSHHSSKSDSRCSRSKSWVILESTPRIVSGNMILCTRRICPAGGSKLWLGRCSVLEICKHMECWC